MLEIDINCDLGEGETEKDCLIDAQLMPFISSCNIACGGHAGNEFTIKRSLENARANNLKVGAHPGYPDKQGFGRKKLFISGEELNQSIREQWELFSNLAKELSISINHIKLHGALYNDVEEDSEIAFQLADTIKQISPSIKVYAQAQGVFAGACENLGMAVIQEGFMDRSYEASGKLTPRKDAGAIITNQAECIQQALKLAKGEPILSRERTPLFLKANTICLHSDTNGALDIARMLFETFKAEGIAIQ